MNSRRLYLIAAAVAIGFLASFASPSEIPFSPGLANAEDKGTPRPKPGDCPDDANHVFAIITDGATIDLPAGKRMSSYKIATMTEGDNVSLLVCVVIRNFTEGEIADVMRINHAMKVGKNIKFKIVERDLKRKEFRGPPSP